jgi:pimeloyl-ACP methyl ester carboxylesterase
MPTATRTVDVPVRGHVLPVTVHGEGGAPIVLLPGGAATCDGYFPDVLEPLAERHTVVVHDRLGSGRAPTPEDPVSLRAWTADLPVVLDALDIDRAVLVGHSLGGAQVALALVEHPERISAALLLDPTPINDAKIARMTARSAGALAAFARIPAVGTPILDALSRRMMPKGLSPSAQRGVEAIMVPGWVEDTARAVRQLDGDVAAFGDRRATAGTPVLVVTAGRKAGSAITAAHERLAEQLGGTCERWPGTGHNGYLQEPELTVQRVEELIARIDA